MDNTNNTFTPASADQIHVAAMNKGCTDEGAKLVVEILSENPYLDSEAVIKEVAGAKSSDKDDVIAKVTKKAEKEDKEEVTGLAAAMRNNAPEVATKDYTHRGNK
jgi:hypothetical protein